jgi:hypothetical protein
MHKNILSYICIVAGMLILWVTTSRSAMKYISELRDNDTWWGVQQFRHGDLASMSGLDFLHKFYTPEEVKFTRPVYDGPQDIVLFIHGDSYLWKIDGGDSVFAGISSLHFIGWDTHYNYHLDRSKRNILILEVSERLARKYYSTTEIIDELKDTLTENKKLSTLGEQLAPDKKYYSSFGINANCFFNKNINQNLQCNLFNYNFMAPMFGCKAAINYFLFSRASGDVVISDDKQFLFFKETVSDSSSGSSFSPIKSKEITELVTNFNKIYDYYKSTGFLEIYLSIIPNTATIMQSQIYNNLIPTIQNDKRLKSRIIDIYSVFKNSKEICFQRGDTHWNVTGKQMWFDEVNKILESLNPL